MKKTVMLIIMAFLIVTVSGCTGENKPQYNADVIRRPPGPAFNGSFSDENRPDHNADGQRRAPGFADNRSFTEPDAGSLSEVREIFETNDEAKISGFCAGNVMICRYYCARVNQDHDFCQNQYINDPRNIRGVKYEN